MSAGLSAEPAKRKAFSFTGAQAAAELKSNKVSRMIVTCDSVSSNWTNTGIMTKNVHDLILAVGKRAS